MSNSVLEKLEFSLPVEKKLHKFGILIEIQTFHEKATP